MSPVSTINEDDDNQSITSSTHSDDDTDEFNYHTHRTCSRYVSCTLHTHQRATIDSPTQKSLSGKSKAIKGDIRSIDNQASHRQKFDGIRWRRICCIPDCSIYLNGGIYFENWLCRKHYLLIIATDKSSESDNSASEEPEAIVSKKKKKARIPLTRKPIKKNNPPQRGDIKANPDGTHEKYNGRTWRPVCKYDSCISFVVRHGYCHRHYVEMRKKNVENVATPVRVQQSKSKTTQSRVSPMNRPKKGDIQYVRQKWNGTKWYSLCQYYTRDCTRRASGFKCAYLCDMHYKEYKAKQNDQSLIDRSDSISLPPKAKKTKVISNVGPSDIMDAENATIPSPCEATIEDRQHLEQYIQTDVTFPLDSIDLRQGCILIEDDDDNNNDEYQSESPQLLVYIKKEEEDFILNKRKIPMEINSLPMNCKLELTKLEL